MKTYNPEERRAKYEWYKSRHICVVCNKEPAFENMTMCPACLEKASARAAAWREKNPEKSKASNKQCYSKKKAEGRCIKCGKLNPNAGNNCRCPTCARNWKIWSKTNRVHRVKPDGICRMCDKPVYGDKKLCYEHWKTAKQNLLKVKSSNKEHPWAMDERARRAKLKQWRISNDAVTQI